MIGIDTKRRVAGVENMETIWNRSPEQQKCQTVSRNRLSLSWYSDAAAATTVHRSKP